MVSWQKYLCFNVSYVILMCALMPVHAVMLSAPFAVVTVVLMFKLSWWGALLLVPATSGLQLLITICWMALLKKRVCGSGMTDAMLSLLWCAVLTLAMLRHQAP